VHARKPWRSRFIDAPSADSATVGMSAAASLSPWAVNDSSSMIARGIICSRWAQAETRNPGANSRVTAAPPTSEAASSTSTERPLRAR